AERVVESDLCPATVRGSQGDVAPLLLASPEYIPFQLNDPNVLKVWGAESGTTPFVTETGVPTAVAVPVHVEPVKNSEVTGPPAWKKFCIVAESVTDIPTGRVGAGSVVVIVGLAL